MNTTYATTTLALSSLKGIGPAFLKKHAYLFDTLNLNATKDNVLLFLEAYKKQFPMIEIDNAIKQSEETVYACEKRHISIISIGDAAYPQLLLELKDPPPIIYCKGNLSALEKVVTVIGTRKPNKNGEVIAERVSTFFSEHGWSICNGLAEGIDSCAIKNANGYFDRVVGVLGGGIDYENSKTLLKNVQKNAEIILENNGLLISEVLPDKKEDTFSVIKSCRIQAGLVHGLILIQSSVDGGSKFTIKSFSELKRNLAFICPVKQDYMLDSYSANRILVEKGMLGLSEIADVKPEKIATSELFEIRSKDDYVCFEQQLLLLCQKDSNQQRLL